MPAFSKRTGAEKNGPQSAKTQPAKRSRGLGKGIGAIFGADLVDDILEERKQNPQGATNEIPISMIEANPFQPREVFDEDSLKGLAESIKSVGLIYPVIVTKRNKKYHIIAGERRLRAVKMAGWDKIPAIVRDVSDLENMSIALIENLQREDLNPIEEAKAYKLLITKLKLKQHDLANQIGKDRTTITNTLRLLNLPHEIQNALVEGKISNGHARTLLSIADKNSQLILLKVILKNGLSVRQLEKEVKDKIANGKYANSSKKKEKIKDAHIKQIESKFREKFGTKVEIQHKGQKGKIEIYFYSLDDFDRIQEILNLG